jgi:hypothetical protein
MQNKSTNAKENLSKRVLIISIKFSSINKSRIKFTYLILLGKEGRIDVKFELLVKIVISKTSSEGLVQFNDSFEFRCDE